MIKVLLEILILLLAIPIAYLLAYLCKDELKILRFWFRVLALVCIFIFVVLLVVAKENTAAILSILFIIIVSIVNLKLSHNKKFLGRYK